MGRLALHSFFCETLGVSVLPEAAFRRAGLFAPIYVYLDVLSQESDVSVETLMRLGYHSD